MVKVEITVAGYGLPDGLTVTILPRELAARLMKTAEDTKRSPSDVVASCIDHVMDGKHWDTKSGKAIG